ncbi:MAG TPA: GNAT family N-acetyltransferase [Solirubrobacteraceae bacterium]|nr:GNAT family N-acetyltransferase [Solirubrobacteraceae bacterium]
MSHDAFAYASANALARESLERAEGAAYRDAFCAAPVSTAVRAQLRMRLLARRRGAAVKLVRAVPRLPRFVTDFDVAVAREEHAEEAAFLIAAAYEMPAAAEAMFAALVGRPGWVCHVALRGGTAVGAAMLFAPPERVGWLGFAATRPDFRGRGAHSALIATRLSAATTAGCYSVVAEAPAGAAGPLRNLERAGFTVAYVR